NETNAFLLLQKNGLHDLDTEYSRIQVFRTTDPVSGKAIQALAIDPFVIQSAMFLESDDLVFEYSRYYHLIRHFKPDFERTLIIGGAGYSFPKEYLRVYEKARIDVVEIDPAMTKIARDYFRLKDDPRMNIIHEDGRTFINRADAAKYDAVLIDAFSSLFTVPQHLTTVEAVTNIQRILTEDGVVIFNLGSAITGKGSQFLQAELRTYQQVFPHLYLFKVNADYNDDRLQNLVIVASKRNDDIDLRTSDETLARLLAHRYSTELPLSENILTDDLAPVEYYNSIAQKRSSNAVLSNSLQP
ncbi:MAG: fused MFS/spermidine synthase, partial [Acidobacteriota bacterium]